VSPEQIMLMPPALLLLWALVSVVTTKYNNNRTDAHNAGPIGIYLVDGRS
jgi:hypothetical protein